MIIIPEIIIFLIKIKVLVWINVCLRDNFGQIN